jgi:hypothetical protein
VMENIFYEVSCVIRTYASRLDNDDHNYYYLISYDGLSLRTEFTAELNLLLDQLICM